MAIFFMIASSKGGGGNNPSQVVGWLEPQLNEVEVQNRAPGSYTVSMMTVRVTTVGAAQTWRFRNNGANGNQVVSILLNQTGVFQDLVHTDSLVTGDLFNSSCSAAGGAVPELAFKLSGITPFPLMERLTVYSTASTTFFRGVQGLTGALATGANEAWVQYKAEKAFVWNGMRFSVRTNTRSTATTVGSRKNGANGNQTVSVPGSATGVFSDLVNSDSVAIGDLINWAVTTGTGAGDFFYGGIHSYIDAGGTQVVIDTCYSGSGMSQPWYSGITAVLDGLQASLTENDVKDRLIGDFRASKFFVSCRTNTRDGVAAVDLRQNNLSTTLAVSIPAITTGSFEDLTHTVDLADGDFINYRYAPAGTSGSATLGVIGMLLDSLPLAASTGSIIPLSTIFWG